MKTLTIECYDFPEFCKRMQDAIQEGYEFDFESNERFPTSFGGYYNVVLVKYNKGPYTEVDMSILNKDVVISDSVLTTKTGSDDFGSTVPLKKIRKGKNSE